MSKQPVGDSSGYRVGMPIDYVVDGHWGGESSTTLTVTSVESGEVQFIMPPDDHTPWVISVYAVSSEVGECDVCDGPTRCMSRGSRTWFRHMNCDSMWPDCDRLARPEPNRHDRKRADARAVSLLTAQWAVRP